MALVRSYLNKCIPNIYEHVQLLHTLQLQLNQCLPKELIQNCFVANFYQGSMIIGVTDASWILPLQYELPKIRDYLRKETNLKSLVSIKLKVLPKMHIVQKQVDLKSKKYASSVAKESLKILRIALSTEL